MSSPSFAPKPGLTLYTADNNTITLDQEIGKGGEGSVWSLAGSSSSQAVAKFYHQGLSPEKAKKIEAMCRLKTESLLRIAAWPTNTLRPSSSSLPQGLLMPRIVGYQEAHLLYTPKSRRRFFPEAQLPFILHASINIARAFATVHAAGQVIGDVNHANLMIAKDATVRLIDCDSFEITDGASVFPCPVGVPPYTPPELQGQTFSGVRRTAQHDAFGLAVLLFHMLFLGRHPFSGIFRQGKGDKTIEDAIREFRFAYLPDVRVTEMEQPSWVPRLNSLPAEIGNLFLRAFSRDGAAGKRPASQEWIPALDSLSRNLKVCTADASHHYFNALTACPWCTAERACGIPMFGITITPTVVIPDLDIKTLWLQIEAVKADTSAVPQFAPAFLAQCQQDSKIAGAKSNRRKMRLMAVASALVGAWAAASAVAATATTQIPLFLAVAGFLTAVVLWRFSRIEAASFTREHKEASRVFHTACARWSAAQNPPDSFQNAKRMLKSQKTELENLATSRVGRMTALKANLRAKQLQRHLEKFRIEDASIPGIGAGRTSLLLACGIEDASDVTDALSIKGFGPALKANLLAWRQSIEKKFVFDPNEPLDPADIRALENEIAQKKVALVQALSKGPATLKQILEPWQAERAQAIAMVNSASRALAQAEVNKKALGRI